MARIDRTAFAKALHEAHEREHDQRWQDAIDLYADVLASVGPSADPEGHAMRAIALMRRGNALMELRRWDEARGALDEALHEAHEREHDLRWQDAIDLYADLLASLGPSADPERRAMRAIALMRRGNALMELRRWDEARGALDEALHDAKASGDRAILAQALLAAGVFAANRDDRERAEAFLLDALERFHRDDALASLQGRGWAFLNLATLYGKTGRLDLAFVTFT